MVLFKVFCKLHNQSKVLDILLELILRIKKQFLNIKLKNLPFLKEHHQQMEDLQSLNIIFKFFRR